MVPEIKQKWINALRSGEYKQGDGFLCHNNTYCCLGVLVDLAVKEGVTEWYNKVDSYNRVSKAIPRVDETTGEIQAETGVLTPQIREWAGLTDNNPVIEFEDTDDRDNIFLNTELITELNDSLGFNFHTLAKLIEKQL